MIIGFGQWMPGERGCRMNCDNGVVINGVVFCRGCDRCGDRILNKKGKMYDL